MGIYRMLTMSTRPIKRGEEICLAYCEHFLKNNEPAQRLGPLERYVHVCVCVQLNRMKKMRYHVLTGNVENALPMPPSSSLALGRG